MTLQLERDSRTEVQAHLDELTGRVTLIFAVIVGLTFAFSTQIDGWLDALLKQIDPCTDSCLNLYDPARWSAVRWLSATLAAIAAASPLICQQIWAFSNKGLLPSERKWMIRWMFGGTCLTLIISATTLLYGLPYVFNFGHGIQTEMGLTARYDAVLMLSITLSVIWTQTIVSLSILGMAIAGVLGVLNKETADWWRLRCYALVVMLLYASLPELGGLAFMLILASIFTIEVLCSSWFNQHALQTIKTVELMDGEGGVRRPVIVECQCSGAAVPLPQPLNIGVPILKYNGLCTSEHERELAYGAFMASKTTDAYITGCSSMPLSHRFKTNCASIGVRLDGLNLLERQSYRTRPQQRPDVEFELMLAQVSDPWPEASRLDRVLAVMKENLEVPYVYMTATPAQAWGQQLKPNEVLIRIEEESHREFKRRAQDLGVQLRQLLTTT